MFSGEIQRHHAPTPWAGALAKPDVDQASSAVVILAQPNLVQDAHGETVGPPLTVSLLMDIFRHQRGRW